MLRGRNIWRDGAAIDHAQLNNRIAWTAHDLDRPPRDARVALGADGSVDHITAQSGLAVDVQASSGLVVEALIDGASVADLVVREIPPAVPDDLVQPAWEQLERALGRGDSTPLTLTFSQQSWPLGRAEVAQLLRVEGGTEPNRPAKVLVEEHRLRERVGRLAVELNQDKQDARFAFNGGALKVLRASREGRQLDTQAAVAQIAAGLLAGDRTVELPVRVQRPAVSSDHPESLGIVERIETSSTSFSGSIPEKKWNIRLAAERLNGIVVPPGGMFSFNEAVGPTTLEAGFRWGFGLAAGRSGVRTVPSVAGGICQVATTLFQPVFWAGYQLEVRTWHLYWIPAYTSRGVVGLDVTVDEDANLDFKWINPTDGYVLIQTATDNDNVYMSLYGKKPSWKVEVGPPVIANRVAPNLRPVVEDEPSLPWGRRLVVQTAREGFDVAITRRVITDGSGEPRVLRLTSKYQPAGDVTLVGIAGRPADSNLADRAEARETPKTDENRPVGQSPPASGERGSAQPWATAAPAATPIGEAVVTTTTPDALPRP